VINRYIFKIPFTVTVDNIFQSSGACHPINLDTDYQKYKMVFKNHYSSYNFPYPTNTQQVIFIKHDPKFDFVLLTNMFYRCHADSINESDFDAEIIQKLQISMMLADGSTDQELRNNWYTKLTERHFGPSEMRLTTSLPVFDFDYASFFDLKEFLLELKRTANFLNNTFNFDQSLVELWQTFIDRNQGYQAQERVHALLNSIYNNQSAMIEPDCKIHACINVIVSKTFDLYDGELFDNHTYPANTQQIAQIIAYHIKTFDQRF
jgi:hypothetical protein